MISGFDQATRGDYVRALGQRVAAQFDERLNDRAIIELKVDFRTYSLSSSKVMLEQKNQIANEPITRHPVHIKNQLNQLARNLAMSGQAPGRPVSWLLSCSESDV